MKLKTLFLILGFLSAVAIVATLTTKRGEERHELASEQIVPVSVVESLTRIELKEKDDASVVLTKSEQNHWIIDNEESLPADFDKLKRFTKDLLDLKYERLVTENPERMKTLELGESEIILGTSSDNEAFTLSKGKPGNSGGFYAQTEGQTKAWLVDGSLYFDTDADDWVDKTPFAMEADDAAKISISLKDSDEVFTVNRKDNDAEYTNESLSENETLKQSEIKSLASHLTTLRFSEVESIDDDKVKEALSHAKAFSFSDFDNNQVTINIGRKPEETIEKVVEPQDSSTEEKANNEEVATASDEEETVENAEGTATEVVEVKEEPKVETETIPAGPIYMQVAFSDANHPWHEPSKRFAFKVEEYQFNRLFKARSDLVEIIEKKEDKVEEVTQLGSSEADSDSSKG